MNNSFVAMLWWLKIVMISLFSLFFIIYGLETMMGAYGLKNPMEFVMFFFSASFMILMSGVGLIFSFFKIYDRFKTPSNNDDAGGTAKP
jgi:uncharacterized membrane protein